MEMVNESEGTYTFAQEKWLNYVRVVQLPLTTLINSGPIYENVSVSILLTLYFEY